MLDKMKQVMEMKKQADRIKRELEAALIESNKVNGIKIAINGAQEIKSIEIEEEMITGQDKQKFESNLVQSVNSAIKESQELAAQKMKSVLPSFPGL